MREQICIRLLEIKLKEKFDKNTMKWKNVKIRDIHVSDLQLGSVEYMSQFTSIEIIQLYEAVIRQWTKQY